MIKKQKLLSISVFEVIKFVELTEAENQADAEYDPAETVLKDEKKRIVNNALEKLSDDMRAAVHLVYFEDMTYDDAARVMKKNRKQIDNLLYRAKGELRIILGKDGECLV